MAHKIRGVINLRVTEQHLTSEFSSGCCPKCGCYPAWVGWSKRVKNPRPGNIGTRLSRPGRMRMALEVREDRAGGWDVEIPKSYVAGAALSGSIITPRGVLS